MFVSDKAPLDIGFEVALARSRRWPGADAYPGLGRRLRRGRPARYATAGAVPLP